MIVMWGKMISHYSPIRVSEDPDVFDACIHLVECIRKCHLLMPSSGSGSLTECNGEPYLDFDSTLQDPDRGDEGRP
jgi:hypothetical protein